MKKNKGSAEDFRDHLKEKENNDPIVVMQPITETLEKNYMPYAMSVIVSRAIPEIDGLKPSHRKLLYTMYKMGLLTGKRSKSANVVGQTMKLNPHGDTAIYETLVRLTRGNAALLHPYIDSKGNFGKQYSRDMAYAASRYTEVKLDPICLELFRGLEKEAVDFTDNYDGTMQEPVLFPATFPSILVNSNQGIAVGMASQICSFNLEEICSTTIAYMKDPAVDLYSHLPAPDFESGGQLIYNREAIAQIYETGRGSVKLRAKFKVDKKNSCIDILEIPYISTIEKIIEETCELVKNNRIKEINDIRDESDKDGFKITIDYKKTADPFELMTKLFRFTELEKSFSCNFNLLINGRPRTLGIRQILGEWLSWRRSCVRRETAFDLQKKQERMHLLSGLKKILLDIDKAVRIIRETQISIDVVPNLMVGFHIDELQAEYVADIRLRHLNHQYVLERTADMDILANEIDLLQQVLDNPDQVDALIIKDLKSVIEKYGKQRKTEIVMEEDIDIMEDAQLIDDYNLKMILTEHGYIKKIPLVSLRNASDIKIKEEDRIVLELDGTNKSEVLFFSDQSNVYKMKAYEIKEHKPSELGDYLNNLLSMNTGESIVFMHLTKDYCGELVIGFENGKAARIGVKNYETKTRRKKLVNAFSSKSPVISITYLEKETDFAAYSSIGKILVFRSSLIPAKTTRTTHGVQVMLSKKGSKLVKLCKLSETNITDEKYYRNKRIPATGYYFREGTLLDKQIPLDAKDL
jgi:DNA gyrase subunit A